MSTREFQRAPPEQIAPGHCCCLGGSAAELLRTFRETDRLVKARQYLSSTSLFVVFSAESCCHTRTLTSDMESGSPSKSTLRKGFGTLGGTFAPEGQYVPLPLGVRRQGWCHLCWRTSIAATLPRQRNQERTTEDAGDPHQQEQQRQQPQAQ